MADLNEPHIVTATDAAVALRRDLGLEADGPVDDDLLDLTEVDLDIPVSIMEFPEGVAGAYQRRRNQGFVFLKAGDVPTRQRFTLAHELGHHVLGHSTRIESTKEVGRSTRDPVEQQANYFASEFLVPHSSAVQWMQENIRDDVDLSLEELIRLAFTYHVSPPAMLYRLTTSGLVESQRVRLWDLVNDQQHVPIEEEMGMVEGGDDKLTAAHKLDRWPRIPRQLDDYARQAYAIGFINEQRLGEVLRSENPPEDTASPEEVVDG